MVSEPRFKGGYPALITPFSNDSRQTVDVDSFDKIINYSIENGVSGIVPCGTTGESPTLSHEEHERVIQLAVEISNGRVPVVAGTGSNSTREAIDLTQRAQRLSADAALVVNPYYNKPTQEGLYKHFIAVADSVDIPVIVYNIKGRTGVNVETSTLLRIIEGAKKGNVLGVKEASGSEIQIRDVIQQTRGYDGFSVLSGDDNMTYDLIENGGHGVISVASNLVPREMVAMVNGVLSRDESVASLLNKALSGLFEAEFIETNPIPIKYIMALEGRCQEVYRLPLCEMSEEHKREVRDKWETVKERLAELKY